jgi:enoyl-[acyl-carrier protein] reductase III
MIELEKIAPDGTLRCDGRCEVRLLERLQKAIGDILSDHARSIAGNARTPIEAVAGKVEPAIEQGARLTNGGGLQTDNRAQPVAGGGAQAGAYASAAAPSHAEVAAIVVDTIAEITRYPREILTPEARFDDDLGIDSLKRAEIVTALLNRFGEAPSDLQTLGPMPLTVVEMTDYAAAYFTRSAASSRVNTSEGSASGVRVSPESVDPRPASTLKGAPESPSSSSFWTARNVIARPFEGKVVLVTGAGNGLGRVIAAQIAALGGEVIINSPRFAEADGGAGRQTPGPNGPDTHLWGALGSTAAVERAFREIEERFERLDYYVHNAAGEVMTSLEQATEGHWEEAFRTNVVSYQLCAMRAAKLMHKSGGGRIVALSSFGARRYMDNYGVMGPVKAALESLTMYLAQELGSYNVQVNTVAASPVSGAQVSSAIPDLQKRMENGWVVSPEEIADAVIFLLTSAARKINGCTIVVDGGWSHRT